MGRGNFRLLEAYLGDRRPAVLRDELIGPRTTFRIGGPARIFAQPATVQEAVALWSACLEADVSVRVLGSGANLLVSDIGYDGVVIHLGRLNTVAIDGARVIADAGASFPRLVIKTVQAGLAGFEGLGGIPAAVGGAVFMNAGGRHGEVFDVLESVVALDREGRLRELRRDRIAFGYRRSGLEGHVILSARFAMREENPEALRERFEGVVNAKRATQPVREHSAGCIFKNPPGLSAGRMIEEAGLKGLRIGRAMVSPRHANFIVNTGGAGSDEVMTLIDAVRETVRARIGVELKLEVEFWG